MGTMANLNYIKNISAWPCALPSPWVLIETAFEAGFPVLLEALTFSCNDILKLRAGISYRCGRQLKSIIKAAHGPQIVDATHFLYQLGPAQVETALYFFFIVDLGVKFLADWTSLIYQVQGCVPSNEVCNINANQCAGAGAPGVDVGVQYNWSIASGQCIQPVFLGFRVPSNWSWSLGYSFEWEASLPGHKASVTTWIRRIRPTVFNYGGRTFEPSWWGGTNRAQSVQSSPGSYSPYGYNEYNIMANFTDFAHITGGSAVLTMSSFPMPQQNLIPVSCVGRDYNYGTKPPQPIG